MSSEQAPWYFIRKQGARRSRSPRSMWWRKEGSVTLQIDMTEDGMFRAEVSDWALTSDETKACVCSSLQGAKDWCEGFLKKDEVDSEQ